MIKMKKADGTVSKTMAWNTVIVIVTALFGVAVVMLPDIEQIVPAELYVIIALLIKGIDVGLRQITTQPMKGK